MSFTRRLFGPSRKEIWQQLSHQAGARYLAGSFFKEDRVEATHGEWTVTLDTHAVSTGKTTVVYTRMRAPYVNPDGFRFTIYRRGLFSEIGKLLGMQDVEVGDPEFDRDFIVKGSDEAKLRHLLSNPKLRELIEAQPGVHFSVRDNEGWLGPRFPESADVLTFRTQGVIKDMDRLRALYELFAETLDSLCRMGSAQENAPDVQL